MASSQPINAVGDLIARVVGTQFIQHPTLISVSTQCLAKGIAEAYPTLAFNPITTKLATPNTLGGWDLRLLVNVALDYLRKGSAPDFSMHHDRELFLTNHAPRRLAPTGLNAPPVDMRVIERVIRELALIVPLAFQQALLSFWQQDVEPGVSRWRWLGDWLRSNLAQMAIQASTTETVRGLIKQVTDYPDRLDRTTALNASAACAYLIETTLVHNGRSFSLLAPELLLVQTAHVLLCRLSGAVEVFTSLDEFDRYWAQRINGEFVADQISWKCYEPDGNVFDAQAAVVLNQQLENVAAITLPDLRGRDDLDQTFDAITDPSRLFLTPSSPASTPPSRWVENLPAWLQSASVTQRLAYRGHLLALASAHFEARGRSFLEGVDTLHSFTAKALRAQMLIDQPLAPGYNPDEVELTFAVAAGYPGGAGIVERTTLSLTDFALRNLAGAPKGTMTIRHTGEQLIQAWTTSEYLVGLVQRVDIGKAYPEHVKRLLLSDNEDTHQRQRLFSEQLRAQLPLNALELAIQRLQGFTPLGYHYVAALMQRSGAERVVEGRPIVIRALALLRRPGALSDRVSNMFLIEAQSDSTGPVILYRPLYAQVLTQYPDRAALFAALAQPGALQDSVLAWLSDSARPVYANGGFDEPHILRFGVGSEFAPIEPVHPATLAGDAGSEELMQYQRNSQLLTYLFGEHARALVDLADRESVSNAESRWAILLEGAGLLLNTLLVPLLKGPALSIAWLLMLGQSLARDIPALESPDLRARELAWVDLLSSLSLALLHGVAPSTVNLGRMPEEVLGTSLALLSIRRSAINEPVTPPVIARAAAIALPDVKIAEGRTAFDFAFSNALNHLSSSQRAQAQRLQVARPAQLPAPIESGNRRGLYRIDGRLHALIDNALYRVGVDANRLLILDTQDTSRTGPWLTSDGQGRWTMDLAPKLRGGSPSSRIKHKQGENRAALQKMAAEQARLSEALLPLSAALKDVYDGVKTQRDLYQAARARLKNWWRLLAETTDARKVEFLRKQHEEQSARCQDLKHSLLSALDAFNLKAGSLVEARRALIKAVKPQVPALDSSDFEATRSSQYEAISASQLLSHSLHLQMALDSSTSPQGESVLEIIERVNLEAPIQTPDAYRELIARFTDMHEIEEQLLADTRALDGTLNEQARESARGLNESRAFIRNLPTQEMADPVNVLLNSLTLLISLSIDKLNLTDAAPVQYFTQSLSERQLELVTSSHIALRTYSHFSVGERKAVLTTAINHYASVARAARALIELEPRLERATYHARFLERLAQARQSAEADLAGLIREEQGIFVAPTSPVLREPRRSTQRVIKTQQRGAVVGEAQALRAGQDIPIVAVRHPLDSRTLARFVEHPNEGVWKELVEVRPQRPAPAPTQRSLGTLKNIATQLIEQANGIERSIVYQMRKLQDPARLEQVDPMDWDLMLTRHADKLTGVIGEIDAAHAAKPGVPALLGGYRREVNSMTAKARSYCGSGYKAQRPTQENVDYLWTHGQVDINLVHRRQLTASGDYVAEFSVREKHTPTVLWYAHFHYADGVVADSAYSVAHLKLRDQRYLLQKDLLRNAGSSDGALLRVVYAPVSPPLDHKLFLTLLQPPQ
jgi:hypothetical protein